MNAPCQPIPPASKVPASVETILAKSGHARTITCLEALVSFDTTSRDSNLALIEWVERYLNAFGIESRRINNEDGTKANLWATIGPAVDGGIILSGHTDVVPVDGQDWDTDPFVLTAHDDKLYGRGSSDMKGFLAAVLAKVPELARADLARPVHIAFSYDEEVGCLGVRSLIAQLKDASPRPSACLVGEPTGMEVVVAHKTKRSLRVTVNGKAAHSSLAPLAVNAVEYAARLVVFIREVGERLKREGPLDPDFDVAHTTAHTGVFNGGTQLNIVPELCVFDFEFRALPAVDVDALVEEVKAYARDVLETEMRAVAPETSIVFEAISGFPGLETPPESDLVGLVKALAGRNRHTKVAYGTEAGLFSEAEIPTVICGPGHIAQAHKPNEFVETAQLAACDDFLDRLVTSCSR